MTARANKVARVHTDREKQLMARGKTAKAKAAAKRDADLLDTTVGSGATDTTPAQPAAPPPTPNQAIYRMLTKQLRLKTEMLEHWGKAEQLAGQLEPNNWKGFHALAQRKQTETEKAVLERKMAEVLKQDPDADK